MRTLLDFVKIEHTLFALPFVLAGMLLGLRETGALALDAATWRTLLLVLVAATGARTLGMTLNRIIDRRIDAANPRTAGRALPAGKMSLGTAVAIAAVSGAALVGAAALLNPLVLWLSPVLALLFFAYPFAKRYTWACHFVLGLVFLCAPAGGYLAVTGSFAGWGVPFLLGVAAFTWVAGFDIIYALLDVPFDRTHAVKSVPAAFGVTPARQLALFLHGIMMVALGLFTWQAGLDWRMVLALIAVGALLAYEHGSVDPHDAEAINKAFFTVNAVVGWLLLGGLAWSLYA